MLNLIIMTGPSGAGKTTAQFVFEESGYFVVDNLLPSAVKPLLNDFINSEKCKNVLFIFQPRFAKDSIEIVKDEFADSVTLKTVLIDCDIQTLLSRFKLTRHVHPLTTIYDMSLEEALKEDKYYLTELESQSDLIVDTTNLQDGEFRKTLYNSLINDRKGIVSVRFLSFGQKHEKPLDVDLVLDTRILPNPYWVENLRDKTGLDPEVIEYLESFPLTKDTLDKMVEYLSYYLKWVQIDGRGNYTIGICCSGGQHRSVYVAEYLAKYFSSQYRVFVYHRDIGKRSK